MQSKIIIIGKYIWYHKRNINLRKEFTHSNCEALVYIKINLTDSDGNVCLAVDSLIKIIT